MPHLPLSEVLTLVAEAPLPQGWRKRCAVPCGRGEGALLLVQIQLKAGASR